MQHVAVGPSAVMEEKKSNEIGVSGAEEIHRCKKKHNTKSGLDILHRRRRLRLNPPSPPRRCRTHRRRTQQIFSILPLHHLRFPPIFVFVPDDIPSPI
ncbi:hypothetical protein U1Q18_016408 [Sarracenia purpurea var. burkii]